MSKIEDKVKETIKDNHLLNGDETVYVAVSGGADSMALLEFCHRNLNQKIVAVHVNHGIRGETADRDQKFVEKYCEDNNIECKVFNALHSGVVVPEHPTEEWARNLRYNYFDSILSGNDVMATAHTLSDLTETVLFRLARGTGLNGLEGIPIKRGYFIRPFLSISRSETEELCRQYNINFVTDESNLTDDYSRNKIRHNVVPILKNINPSVEVSFAKTCSRIQRMTQYLQSVASKELSKSAVLGTKNYHTSFFVEQDDAVREQMVVLFLSKNNLLKEDYVDLILDTLDKYVETDNEVMLNKIATSSDSYIVITNKFISISSPSFMEPLNRGFNDFGSWGHGIRIEKITYDRFKEECKSKFDLPFYADERMFNLNEFHMRSRMPGDKFKPACKSNNRILNFLSKYGIDERENIPLICDRNNNIVCVYDVGFTDGFVPQPDSSFVYKLSFY